MAKRYKEEFKKQLVSLYNNGKSLADLNREYGISKSTISTWIKDIMNRDHLILMIIGLKKKKN